jgi:hypothetical protein
MDFQILAVDASRLLRARGEKVETGFSRKARESRESAPEASMGGARF